VHTDLHGPVALVSGAGKLYWALFIDDFSRHRCIYFLHKKSDALLAYKEFKAEAELLTGKQIKKLRDDKGGEYMSGEFDRFLKEHGTQRQHTTTQTPEQSRVVERANRDIGEGIKAMLSQSGLPNLFWAEAAHTFVHIQPFPISSSWCHHSL
jgi:transposase InsO family protein